MENKTTLTNLNSIHTKNKRTLRIIIAKYGKNEGAHGMELGNIVDIKKRQMLMMGNGRVAVQNIDEILIAIVFQQITLTASIHRQQSRPNKDQN